ncbi:Smr/MutS family protein [Luteimonas sp. YGD11-2]|uniref:Smr/MutS family protein n=1 Tax=Luteimonas sp. YGD11-2 TaxID=2508168 RepID=UPI00100B302D|nr:Smr/MutS family protein [Luteimonas sp. YGD11-2]
MTADRPPPPDDDDAALFRAAIGPVREHTPEPAAPGLQRPRPRPRARMAERDELDARGEFRRLLEDAPLEAGLLAGDSLSYRRDDVPPRVLKRLARGQYAAQDELDLHFANVTQAEAMLRQFLGEARDHGYGCVRVIHGKGRHADGTPVIKNLVDRLLRHRGDVIAYHSAPAAQGGTGAVLVLLRPR